MLINIKAASDFDEANVRAGKALLWITADGRIQGKLPSGSVIDIGGGAAPSAYSSFSNLDGEAGTWLDNNTFQSAHNLGTPFVRATIFPVIGGLRRGYPVPFGVVDNNTINLDLSSIGGKAQITGTCELIVEFLRAAPVEPS